jgi:Tfp pilus assembly PilM family ATPase
MPNLLSRLVDPRYPATAIGLEKGVASVVHLERIKGAACKLRRAATFNIAESLVRPGFDETNIEQPGQLSAVLNELAASAGLLKQKRWSMSLPEATTRTLVLTMESQTQSAAELQEVLKWKVERGFGAPIEELSISKERLQKDSQGRDRYLVIAVRKSVLAEYEAVLESLGWRAGLILPRHLGEAQWLLRARCGRGKTAAGGKTHLRILLPRM